MTIIDEAQARLEQLAVRHAPEQRFLEDPDQIDGRYVTLRDPPGVYYILDTDNGGQAKLPGVRRIQLTFLEVPQHAIHYVEQLGAGWRLDKVELLAVVDKEGHPGVWSATLSHVE